jgi:hypothetical protein
LSPGRRIGLDIPWSVAWSGEQAFRLQPSADFAGLLELDQRSAPGVGEPLFAAIHVTRQRRGIIDLLCHICGRPTAPGDRHVFPVASGGFVTLHDGTVGWGCNVPPVHGACGEIAARECPHLSHLAERPLACLPGDEGRLIPRTDVTPGLEHIAAQMPKDREVVFSCYRLFGPDFAERVRAARAGWEAEAKARRGARPG